MPAVEGCLPTVQAERWTWLTDERAARLLASAVEEPALIMRPADGFPVDAPDTAAAAPFASVLDASRPEVPEPHGEHVSEMVRLCRVGGTIALFACGGEATSDGALAPRGIARVRSSLADAGCRVEREVSFDLLAPLSPLRLGLGARVGRVLAELEEHLRYPSVQRAVQLVETRLVASLDPRWAGRVFVVARKGEATAPRPSAAPGGASDVLLDDGFAREALFLLHDDAVVRWLAFVDAEVLSAFSVPFNLVEYLRELTADDSRREAVRALLRQRRRWWQPGLEAARLCEAACRRLVRDTVAALASAPGASVEQVNVPATLDYDLTCAFNAAIERVWSREAR